VLENVVMLANRRHSWVGIAPFQQVLEKHGGQVYSSLAVSLQFDIELAALPAEALDTIQQAIKSQSATTVPSWYLFYGGSRAANPDEWIAAAHAAMQYQSGVRQHLEQLRKFDQGVRINLSLEKGAELVTLLYEMLPTHIADTPHALVHEQLKDMYFKYEKVEIKDDGLRLKNVSFPRGATLQGLLALQAWLRSFGCHVKVKCFGSNKQTQQEYFDLLLGD
jgi:hypothetical protein